MAARDQHGRLTQEVYLITEDKGLQVLARGRGVRTATYQGLRDELQKR